MADLRAFAVCLIVVLAYNSAEYLAKALDSHIDATIEGNPIKSSSNEYKTKVLFPLIKQTVSDDPSSKLVQINYKLGNRINGENEDFDFQQGIFCLMCCVCFKLK